SIGIWKIDAVRSIISHKSSRSYYSNRLNTPKRSRKGTVKSPARVVAPINVNDGKSIRTDLALGTWPMTISKKYTSIAGYNTSSIAHGMLCTSSINNTTPGSREYKITDR